MFKNEEGFSLLELVVAVGVAGIIAAVALPTFAGIQDKATTTSATYAASASAAEALANSTIGGVNGTTSNNSSYTGGSSSSAAASSSSTTIGNPNYVASVSLVGSDFQNTNYTWWTPNSYIWGNPGSQNQVVLDGLTQSNAQAIINAVNSGASIFTIGGQVYNLSSTATESFDNSYGGWQVRLNVTNPAPGGYLPLTINSFTI